MKPSLSFSVMPTVSRSTSALRLSLCQLPAGGVGRVCELTGDAQFCQRVREMGFGESTFVTKVSGTGTILCQVNGTRVALSHGAAKNIVVEPLTRR
jgi:ferrous iron transport protein A